MGESVLFSIFTIFTGAAVLATLALYARQSLLVGYIVVGILAGPSVAGWVSNPDVIQQIATVGVIFLLFLLGLNLHPQKLLHMFREAMVTTVVSALVFAAVGFAVGWVFGFSTLESLVVAAAVMFSSTIIGLKLLPATELHHQHAGEVIIAVLLLQDVIAIVIMLGLQGFGPRRLEPADVAWVLAALPLLIAGAFVIERFLVRYLLARFDTIQEYVFLVAVGWCLGLAQVAEALHLSYEIGAFVAGVALATSPISRFIAESLRPLRDFFLIMFFFALGAGLELEMLGSVLVPGLLLATAVLLIKPAVFRTLLRWEGERGHLALEVGVRLGQMSEFSLLIAVVALETGVIGARASYLIQLATVLSFMLSSYAIGIRYPTPIAASERLRRD